MPDDRFPGGAPDLVPPSVMEEIRREFLAETEEILESVEEDLRQLRGPDPPFPEDLADRILRHIHSLKGSAGMFGLPAVSSFCHDLEDFLTRARQRGGVWQPEEAALLGRGMVILRRMFSASGPGSAADDSAAVQAPFRADLRAYMGRTAAPTAASHAEEDTAPAGPPAPAQGPHAAGAAPAHLRVLAEDLDGLTVLAGEIHLAAGRLLHRIQASGAAGLARPARREIIQEGQIQARRLAELRRRLLALRMVPIRPVMARFFPIVQSLAWQAGKEVDLRISGEETRVDRAVLEALGEPLLHLVRNAVDHGLETPEARRRAGKPPRGLLSIEARREGHHVTVSVNDDGRGIDAEAVARRARERGLLAAEAHPRDEELWSFLFAPGFSTREQAGEISGRGVGLDVVRRGVLALQGMVEVSSVPGQGTKMSLRVPETLTVTGGLVARQGGTVLAFPLHAVVGVRRLTDAHTPPGLVSSGSSYREEIPLIDLGALFEIPCAAPGQGSRSTIVAGLAEQRLGIIVDRVLGQEELLVRPLGPLLECHPGVAGAAELANGTLALAVDVPFLVASREAGGGEGHVEADQPAGSWPAPATSAEEWARRAGRGRGSLLVRIGRRFFEVDSSRIRTVMTPPASVPVPYANAHFAGIVLFQGKVLPLLDPQSLLGPATEKVSPPRAMVVVDAGGGIGILVTEVLGMQTAGTGAAPRPGPRVEPLDVDSLASLSLLRRVRPRHLKAGEPGAEERQEGAALRLAPEITDCRGGSGA